MSDRVRALTSLVRPQSVVVVGASERTFVGRIVLANLRTVGYPGDVYLVNPRHTELFGIRCYQSVKDLPGSVEAAVLALPSSKIAEALREVAAVGVRAAVVPSGGFAETGRAGALLQEEIAALARQSGIALLGPNCMGVVSLQGRSALYIGRVSPSCRAGEIGCVLQSGGFCETLLNLEGRIAFSHAFTTGNRAGVTNLDCLEFLVRDGATRAIGMMVETVEDADRFAALAREALVLRKPIVLLNVGRTQRGSQVTLSHTGSLAGSRTVWEGFCRQLGVSRVDTLDEWIETLLLFSAGRLPEARGVAVITVSGGEAANFVDVGTESGLEFPRLTEETIRALHVVAPALPYDANPIDCWGLDDFFAVFPSCLERVYEDPQVGTVVIAADLPREMGEQVRDIRMTMARELGRVAQLRPTKLVLLSSGVSGATNQEIQLELAKHRIPMLQGTHETAQAVRELLRYAEHCRARGDGEATAPRPQAGHLSASPPRTSESVPSEVESKELLQSYGVRVPRGRIVRSAVDAAAAAEALGYPVVLKLVARRLAHKSDLGLVRLSLAHVTAVQQAFEELWERAQHAIAPGQVEGVLVEEMVQGGTETIVGVTRDRQFGLVVMFGLGGVFAEVLNDVAVRVLPITQRDGEEMLREVRGYPALVGARGAPADIGAIVDVILTGRPPRGGLRPLPADARRQPPARPSSRRGSCGPGCSPCDRIGMTRLRRLPHRATYRAWACAICVRGSVLATTV